MATLGEKLNFYLERLSSRPRIGGLHMSDGALQYLLLDGETRVLSLRVPPGVIREGKIVDETQYANLLKQFRTMVRPEKPDQDVPVVVTLPASLVYVQSFTIPNVGKEKLEEAAKLNMQMISPIPPEAAYMSFQLLNEAPDHYELLGGFAERTVIDHYARLLQSARFSPIAFEFPSLSLTRLITSVVGTMAQSSLAFQISSDGMNLFIFRNGLLYFDYFRSWHSIQGESREISKSLFEEAVAQEVQKVMNFVSGKFKERPAQVYLLAPGFEKDIQDFLQNRFGLSVVPLMLRSAGLEPAWYVALGAALRGKLDRAADVFISLAPLSSAELFYHDQLLNFTSLWRNALAGVLIVFILFFGGAAMFLSNQVTGVTERLSEFRGQLETKESADLKAKADEFNSLVRRIQAMQVATDSWYGFLKKVQTITAQNGVSIDRLDINALKEPIGLTAHTKDNATVLQFKTALASDPSFVNITLDVSKITTLADNSVSFMIGFQYRP